jgi:K(+)-stimulated pyrophosphate-energized sodium pump
MNILIKLTCLIGLVIAPILGSGTHTMAEGHGMATCCSAEGKCTSMTKEECIAKGCTNTTCEHMVAAQGEMKQEVSKRVMIEKTNVDGKVKATVTTTINGKTEVMNIEGTEAEVMAKVDSIQ